MQQLGVHATGVNGENITDKVVLNLTQVNINQQGEYPVMLSVMDATGQSAQTSVTLNVRPMREGQAGSQPSQPAEQEDQQQKDQPRKKKHNWLIAVLIVIILLLVWWGVSAHHRAQEQAQVDNNNQQSSQISNNSSSISKLSSDNQKLANQVAELKGAVKQYHKDNDQQALDQRLDKIQSQNQQLQDQVQNNSTKEHLSEVTNVVNKVRQDPDNGVQIVNNLKNESGFKDIWNNISSQVQGWLDKFSD